MNWGNWGSYGRGIGFGWPFMMIFSVLVILCIVLIVQSMTRNTGGKYGEETPLDILKRRYAKGEINKEEFDRMRDDIKKS